MSPIFSVPPRVCKCLHLDFPPRTPPDVAIGVHVIAVASRDLTAAIDRQDQSPPTILADQMKRGGRIVGQTNAALT